MKILFLIDFQEYSEKLQMFSTKFRQYQDQIVQKSHLQTLSTALKYLSKPNLANPMEIES